MAVLDMHRAFRADLSSTTTQEVVINFLKTQQIVKAAIYYEVAQQTKKPHLQGWMAFSGEQELKAFSKAWYVFKRANKLDKSNSSVAKFRKGDTAMVYAAKDGNIVWQHGVTTEELEELSKRSYQKGETKKETFLNAIVQRMREKGCKTDSQVYFELTEYYFENGKELSPWRLTAQCNTVCRMLWGKIFSEYMSQREHRYFNGPEEEVNDSPPPEVGSTSQDDEEDCGPSEADSPERSVLQEDVVQDDFRCDQGSRVDCDSAEFQDGGYPGVYRVSGNVRQLQDQCSQGDVYPILGQQRSEPERSDLYVPSSRLHDRGSGRYREYRDDGRAGIHGARECANDPEASGAFQYLHQESGSGDTDRRSVGFQCVRTAV